MTSQQEAGSLSVVVIGRNEGARLTACLKSVKAMSGLQPLEIIYVDTNSKDDSVARAEREGVKIIQINPEHPTAAYARNIGWKAASGTFVLFLDGDNELVSDFVEGAIKEFANPEIGIVCGQIEEKNPEASVYQKAYHYDAIYPTGIVNACGGSLLIRRHVLEEVGGYNCLLIAGEEPEMCQRIRDLGYQILRLDCRMSLHDMGMKTFSQYWTRCFRTGYAYALVSEKTRNYKHRIWKWDVVHNFVVGGVLILGTVASLISLAWTWVGIGVWIFFLMGLILRKTFQKGSVYYAIHTYFQHIPMLCGQVAYQVDCLKKHQRKLIEYK